MKYNSALHVICAISLSGLVGCDRADRVNSGPSNASATDGSFGSEGDMAKSAVFYYEQAGNWLQKGDYDRALKNYDHAIRIDPDRAAFWNNRGFTWHMKGIEDKDRASCEERALSDYAQALRLDPQRHAAMNNRAWLRATTKVERCRNGKLAVEEATKACQLTGWRNALYLDTLAVACAEAGDFEQAIRWQRKALEDQSYRERESATAGERLALFGMKQPVRE